jgi:hypothetical protein
MLFRQAATGVNITALLSPLVLILPIEAPRMIGDAIAFSSRLYAFLGVDQIVNLTIAYSNDLGTTYFDRGTIDVLTPPVLGTMAFSLFDLLAVGTNIRLTLTRVGVDFNATYIVSSR